MGIASSRLSVIRGTPVRRAIAAPMSSSEVPQKTSAKALVCSVDRANGKSGEALVFMGKARLTISDMQARISC